MPPTIHLLTINPRTGTVQAFTTADGMVGDVPTTVTASPTLPLRPIIDRAQAAGRRAPDLEDFAEAFGGAFVPITAPVVPPAAPPAPLDAPLPAFGGE